MTRLVAWMVAMASVQGMALYCGIHATLNVTPSLPMGLYWRLACPRALAAGLVVELSPPDALLPYLDGTPAGTHILKQLVGIPGDTVCWDEASMRVNGAIVAPRLPERPLPVGLQGCRTLGTEELAVIGTHPRSLDSRDIGTVDRRRLLHRVIPLWTWRAAS